MVKAERVPSIQEQGWPQHSKRVHVLGTFSVKTHTAETYILEKH